MLKLTTAHTGKMKNIWSLSTSTKTNPNCERNAQIKGSVCEKCYARKQMKMYKQMSPCYERNAEILTSRLLDDNELPTVPVIYFRFEAFGDLINWVQCANYFRIARKNPQTKFCLFTKNPRIVAEAVEAGEKKPRNLVIVQSSLFLNQQAKPANKYIDKVFTVYDNCDGVEISCGARNCFECHKCYKKTRDVEYINEKLKQGVYSTDYIYFGIITHYYIS